MIDLSALEVHQQAANALAAEERAFQRQRAQLLKQYPDQFVAVYQGKVVDHDPNDEELARRMFERVGDVPFYVVKVEQTPTVYELPSP
ncbi:MAG: DUF5678 domain-containing protein, partial [Chloroflexota bacterium]